MNISLLRPKKHPVTVLVATSPGQVVARIATATSVQRTRSEDALRADANGGTAAEMADRVRAAVEKLEKVAQQLEAATA